VEQTQQRPAIIVGQDNKMMLRIGVAKVLFNRHAGELTNKEIEVCNKFIDDYNKVKDIINDYTDKEEIEILKEIKDSCNKSAKVWSDSK